jgi:hypothetical protein
MNELLPRILQREYGFLTETLEQLLSLVVTQKALAQEEIKVLDKTVQSYIDTGVLAHWTKENDLLTVVIPLNVVFKADATVAPDENGRLSSKPRATIDYRYVNAITGIPHSTVELPSVVGIATKVRKDARLAKQNLKPGYHLLG